ncbi:(2Fe-2S)-binding protein [Glaciimonas sp. PCH181]|uniref:(2Fe-2S)-binding protein n=1 Tax=Glaciimonas sp. PCH181 TaxID=2133943 RepID=UPI000D3ACDA5|nr:(2Fe-2S)-binding protein [Glaciimonas sp. PCH181]PUA17122.1 NAD(FAD)-dependent dehydrogenase [Glaciimonas sp. PCH181]
MTILIRVAETERSPVAFWLDGEAVTGLSGDSVLTAVLTSGDRVRVSEFSGMPRAGFCLIGACQDCWMRTEDGAPLRACTTLIQPGMRLLTSGIRGDA